MRLFLAAIDARNQTPVDEVERVSTEETTDAPAPVTPASMVTKIRLSLNGRPIRSFSFTKDTIAIGRDPEADVFLDNPGVSRHHLRLEKCAEGYRAEDLGSANGTILNDQALTQAVLKHDDVLRVGKFSLWICYQEDRRQSPSEAPPSPNTSSGTTVLTTAELDKMVTKMRGFDTASKAAHLEQAVAPRSSAKGPWNWVLLAAALGGVLGSGLTWWLTR
jgi:pSer/pThr/pTyr-binding forkhead associated (FHA) protein